MIWFRVLYGILLSVAVSKADLPGGCTPLNDFTYSTVDPTSFYEANSELSGVAPPLRIGSWRADRSIPTQHFAINQCKNEAAPIRLMPYSAVLSDEGITYDAYTMERWSDSARSDEMQQQTPSRVDAPWDKVTSLGTNMKQLVSGPDGNPKGAFTGISGIRVGIAGSGEPVWTDFGEMYADFVYTDDVGGSLEVLLVRGAGLLTHRFTSANPVLFPWCGSSINGVALSFSCRAETDMSDGGEGFLDGTCSGGVLHIVLHTTKPVSLTDVQWAANTQAAWGGDHTMHTCGPECVISGDGKQVDITVPGASGTMAYAINVIGKYVIPPDWTNTPYTAPCTLKSESSDGLQWPFHRRPRQVADFCTTLPALDQCTSEFCKDTACQESLASPGNQDFRLVIQLDQPISGIDQIQIAINTGDQWDSSHPMMTCTPAQCTLQSDMKTLIYCSQMPPGVVKYAVNVIGRFVQPTGDWETQPFEHQCGGSGTEIGAGNRFVLELDEPKENLPGQTRKFVVYFTEDVIATADANGVNFSPVAGGKYTGLLQMGYAGSTPRGDLSAATFFDQYRGFYSYHSTTTFCAQNGIGYINVNWNIHDEIGPTGAGNLLTITMPHHESLLASQGALITTPFTFKGFVGNFWLLQENLPRASMDPDPAKIDIIRNNPQWNQDVVSAMDTDTTGQDLNGICSSSDSYGVGKAIAMVARLASLSRAFATSHYNTLDPQILSCLNKWLRIDDTLADAWKFRYDTVYGGLLLRSGPPEQPINPGANYGFPLYSDHHFHLGYFLYAMAYYATHYPSWLQANRERVLSLARDVGNPSLNDKYFPIVRNKDFYVGISWATGVVGGLRQAESSTEAIMCYHGLAALGLALGDTTMQSVGQLMLAVEIRSVREYYHVRANNQYFFPQHIKDYGTIGQFAEDAIFYYTLNWPCDPYEFPMRHACLVGIQVIPIISVSGLYMDQEWANAVLDICGWAIDPWSAPGADQVDQSILRPVSLGWGTFCHAVTSQSSSAAQQAAATYVKDLTPAQLVGGTGVASTLTFIYAST